MGYRTASNELQAPCGVCRTSVPREEITFEASGEAVCPRCATSRTLERLGTPRPLSPGWGADADRWSWTYFGAVMGGFIALRALIALIGWLR